jgi:two-component system sensor histidine kinase RegB
MAVPIEVLTGPAQDGASSGSLLQEPVTERNPGVLYGLGNLVENAVDLEASKVDVEARWSNDAVKIVIGDDGSGFPANVLEQLGEPFVTTRRAQSEGPDTTDEHAGMGLGFFIAKTLLERSGARLELANRPLPESGAVVTVVWPRAKFEHVPEAAAAGAEPVA